MQYPDNLMSPLFRLDKLVLFPWPYANAVYPALIFLARLHRRDFTFNHCCKIQTSVFGFSNLSMMDLTCDDVCTGIVEIRSHVKILRGTNHTEAKGLKMSELNTFFKSWLAKVAMDTKAHGFAAFICFHPTKPCSTGWLRGIQLSTIRQSEQFTITGRGVTPVLQRVPSFNTLKGCAAHIFWLLLGNSS